MKDSTKRILLIGGSALVIAGVAYYFLVYRKKSKSGDASAETESSSSEQGVNNESSSSSSSSSSSIKAPAELNTKDKIKDFQKFVWWYMNFDLGTGGPQKNGVDGIWGPKSQQAWDKYALYYRASLNYQGKATKSYIPPNLKLVLSKLGSRASYVQLGDAYVVIVQYKYKNKNYVFTFYDNNRFMVQESVSPYKFLFMGDYVNGGSSLEVTKDDYSKISKVNSGFNTDFWQNAKRLFEGPK